MSFVKKLCTKVTLSKAAILCSKSRKNDSFSICLFAIVLAVSLALFAFSLAFNAVQPRQTVAAILTICSIKPIISTKLTPLTIEISNGAGEAVGVGISVTVGDNVAVAIGIGVAVGVIFGKTEETAASSAYNIHHTTFDIFHYYTTNGLPYQSLHFPKLPSLCHVTAIGNTTLFIHNSIAEFLAIFRNGKQSAFRYLF